MKIVLGIIVGISVFASVLIGTKSYAATQQCIDGTKASNLQATLTGRGSVQVGPKDNHPLCSDVSLNLSSYNLPDTYNGQGFKNNSTAIPQTQFANAAVMIGKGTTEPVTVTVATPDACKATQVDLYYGQNQTQITTSEGLVDTDAIVGKIYNGTGSCVTATTTVQTVTPTASVTPQPTPTKLADTGNDPLFSILATALLAGGAYTSARLFKASRA